MMTIAWSRQTSIAELERVLPVLVQDLSLARAQIVIDQIRSNLVHDQHSVDRSDANCEGNRPGDIDPLVFITAGDMPDLAGESLAHVETQRRTLAALIAVCSPVAADGPNDAATVLHAGRVTAMAPPVDVIDQLRTRLDSELNKRGIRFVQWATDPIDDASAHSNDDRSRFTASPICDQLGFQRVGTLDYLHGPVNEPLPFSGDRCERFGLIPVDLANSDEWGQFTDVVESTYQDTHDCPELAEYRNASDILRSYRSSPAFSPDSWFWVMSDGQRIGCLIMANHGGQRPDAAATDADSINGQGSVAETVSEIVYMGVVPDARGKGHGRRLVHHAFATAERHGAKRMILAVDQRNAYAKRIYRDAGLSRMLSETVWVKRI